MEYLLNDLNQSDVCGPVHRTCKTCGRLLVQKQGDRKYCWKGCREKAWSYANRKEYLKGWQRGGSPEFEIEIMGDFVATPVWIITNHSTKG